LVAKCQNRTGVEKRPEQQDIYGRRSTGRTAPSEPVPKPIPVKLFLKPKINKNNSEDGSGKGELRKALLKARARKYIVIETPLAGVIDLINQRKNFDRNHATCGVGGTSDGPGRRIKGDTEKV